MRDSQRPSMDALTVRRSRAAAPRIVGRVAPAVAPIISPMLAQEKSPPVPESNGAQAGNGPLRQRVVETVTPDRRLLRQPGEESIGFLNGW